jgi:hypothetical protein
MPASDAIAPFDGPPGARRPCSRTERGLHARPRWELSLGADPVAVRGIRLTLPHTCVDAGFSSSSSSSSSSSNSIGSGVENSIGGKESKEPLSSCGPAPIWSLFVYVSDGPMAAGTGGSSMTTCVKNAMVSAGRPIDLDCGRWMMGRTITVVALPPAWNNATLAGDAEPQQGQQQEALALCGVRVVGALPLLLQQAMAAERAQHAASPAVLRPLLALAADGNDKTCIDAGRDAATSSWRVRLRWPFRIFGVSVVGDLGPSAVLSLLDLDNKEVVRLPGPAGITNGALHDVANNGVDAFGVLVTGFSKLCEVRLLAASTGPSARTLRPGPGWTAAAAGSVSADLVVDLAGWRTCFATGAGVPPALTITLEAPFRASEVRLVSDRFVPGVVVGMLPVGVGAASAAKPSNSASNSFLNTKKTSTDAWDDATWELAARCGSEPVDLHPWEAVTLLCDPYLLEGATLLIRSFDGKDGVGQEGEEEGIAQLSLCQVELVGEALSA